jgi:DNA-binding CsgD family transcriptional regulator
MLEETLDGLAQAVVVTDLDARVLHVNKAAGHAPGKGGQSLAALAGDEIARTVGLLREENRRVATGLVRDTETGRRILVRSVLLPKGNISLTRIQVVRDDEDYDMPVWDVLSPREQVIARLVAKGLTTRQVAEEAYVSENTVKMHLKRIFAKTGIHNRAELVQRIWRDGKTDLESQDVS